MIIGDQAKPLIVQGDQTILLETYHPLFEQARDAIAPFCELEKSPEHIHTYRLSALSLWNAASSGIGTEEIQKRLSDFSRFPVPQNIIRFIQDIIGRYGSIVLEDTVDPMILRLSVSDPFIRDELNHRKQLHRYLIPDGDHFLVHLLHRGTVKVELIKIGYPVQDTGSLREGEPFPLTLRETTLSGRAFHVRDYQRDAAKSFWSKGTPGSGFGVIVLPCGAGKTIVGLTVMSLLQTRTLILTTNVAAVHQWIDELCDKTDIQRENIGEYSGDQKQIKPVTVATYQILTYHSKKNDDYPHFSVFKSNDWGLIIYDEVHLLPAPVFRITAELQSVRRLGLTATLIREDGKEREVFSLVGPKRYDVPWKEMEQKGWIAEAYCREIRVELPDDLKSRYAASENRGKYRIASENYRKEKIVLSILENHAEDSVLVIGQYVEQLTRIAKTLKVPLITGSTPNKERELIYARFREGSIKVIVVSKVANFAIDLPDASVAIQISGSFGSRQEEAQRLGRILRPKQKNSFFYSIVSHYTLEETFALNRQKFLTEQGYEYHIEIWDEESA
ncbi:MAG: DEAD/DEAH box helicase [Spirochaetales bacterium]|nr:DEAD/DEAH box helicase [Spirochaetales bacterium]